MSRNIHVEEITVGPDMDATSEQLMRTVGKLARHIIDHYPQKAVRFYIIDDLVSSLLGLMNHETDPDTVVAALEAHTFFAKNFGPAIKGKPAEGESQDDFAKRIADSIPQALRDEHEARRKALVMGVHDKYDQQYDEAVNEMRDAGVKGREIRPEA